MSVTNPNNTTSGDNSSDSASNKKNTCRTELEIIEIKLKKCNDQIESMKKKVQREWSLQMNNHLKNFYPNEENKKNNMFSSPVSQLNHQTESPADLEKQILLMQRKLQSYERRKQKIILEQSKASENETTESLNETSANSNVTNTNSVHSNDNSNLSSNTSTMTSGNNNNLVNNSSLTNTDQIVISQQSNNLQITHNASTMANNNRNLSFTANGKQEFLERFQTELTNSNMLTTNDEKPSYFYVNQDNGMLGAGSNLGPMTSSTHSAHSSSLKSQNNPSTTNIFNGVEANAGYPMNIEEYIASNAAILATNKSLQNMIYMQAEQIFYLKSQNEKTQSDLEDLQKKIDENQQVILKELQHSYNQISEPIHKLSFNLYKSYDQKLDEFKSASLTSMQALGYNFHAIQRDVKEIKEDVTFMKNRIDIVEKTQKSYSVEQNPTNYYQLFYKLLDIFLTLATIILLAFTNLIASIKFVFLLYPRSIVISIFLYFLLFYLVDYEKLADLHSIFTDPDGVQFDSDFTGANLKQNFFKKTWLTIYRKVFPETDTIR